MNMNLYCLGPQRTYSDHVAQEISRGVDVDIKYLGSFPDIFNQVRKDSNSLGLIVVENSTTSDIHLSIDHLFRKDIKIVAEYLLNVRLHLITSKDRQLSDITKVISKWVALDQCSDFIKEHNLERVEVESTALGLEQALEIEGAAALGGRQMLSEASHIVGEDVGNQKINSTRFLLIANPDTEIPVELIPTEINKISVIVELPHKQGSLAQFLNEIAEHGGNLTKIESRPIPGSIWEYRFLLDIIVDPSRVEEMTSVIEKNASNSKIIGKYKNGEIIES